VASGIGFLSSIYLSTSTPAYTGNLRPSQL